MDEFGHAGAPIGLAEPGNAGVGLDAHQHPGEVAVYDGQLTGLILALALRQVFQTLSLRWEQSQKTENSNSLGTWRGVQDRRSECSPMNLHCPSKILQSVDTALAGP